MMMKSALFAALLASASAFAPASVVRWCASCCSFVVRSSRSRRPQSQRAGSVALNAEEMSKSVPFLVRPEKLDGSMVGDMGFDPMRL